MSVHYVPIRVKDFISGSVASTDVYVCIEGTKYIKILHKGETFEPARLNRYQDKNVDMLFLKAEDFSGYVQNSMKLSAMLAKKAKSDPATCVRYLNKASEAVVTELLHNQIGSESIDHVRAINAQFLSSLQGKPNLTMILASLEELGEEFTRHSIGVSMMATLLAIRLNWEAAKTVEIIQLGGYLHDIGFRELPKELCMKPRALMTADEVKLYESHPYRGVQLLESISNLPSEILSVIFDHHEHVSGLGFPRGLKLDRVYPMARLISLADLFCHQTMTSSYNDKPRAGPEAVKHMHELYGRDYPSEYWEAITALIGVDLSIVKKKA